MLDDRTAEKRIDRVLREDPLAPAQNILVIGLGMAHTISYRVPQVRESESLHVHAERGLTVFVHRGHGTTGVADRNLIVEPGGALFVPRAVPHAFRNDGSTTAVAIVVFNPAFDGNDTVPVGR